MVVNAPEVRSLWRSEATLFASHVRKTGEQKLPWFSVSHTFSCILGDTGTYRYTVDAGGGEIGGKTAPKFFCYPLPPPVAPVGEKEGEGFAVHMAVM